ncbi:amidohydrolase family protein [Rhodococcus olei]|uniref:Amidohydrolase family protein n=1 Tax=Rhodococcus olei TaxID=2161675 RepID=A0ABP8PR32_9NOCA
MTVDLVIRGGNVYDGTGSPEQIADIAIVDGVITQIGVVDERGAEEIDARGKIVTPGFVDIHTHYDGQAVWSDQLTPSSWHGVTTAVMGNCGVGFAPCRPQDRNALVELMEGVEDIPAPVMHEGLTWQWETFEEYLDVLERTPRDIDLCALVPHAPLRVYVMGERALRLEPANEQDIETMRGMVADAVRAGAFGVSTSRTTSHATKSGTYTPTLLARQRELAGLAHGMTEAGRGILEVVMEGSDPEVRGEYNILRDVLKSSGRRGVFSLAQTNRHPHLWRELLAFADETIADGVSLRPVVAPRAIGMLLGLEGSQNPFAGTRTYAAMAHLPLQEQVERMTDPTVRAQILSEDPMEFSTFPFLARIPYTDMFRLGSPSNYTPRREDSIAAIAEREGRTAPEVAYDVMLENAGMGFIYVPFTNYVSGDLSVCQEMLANRNTIMGLGDGGAHVGFIVDAGFPTWLLAYWVNERGFLSVSEAIRRLTSDTADEMGLGDRGRIAIGLRADLNVIDLARIGFGDPYVAYDLPNGAKRLLQRGIGYEATIVAGRVTYREGVDTGARPGRLVRSGR